MLRDRAEDPLMAQRNMATLEDRPTAAALPRSMGHRRERRLRALVLLDVTDPPQEEPQR